MNLKPLADRVILKQTKAEDKTKGGILLATSAQEKPEIYDVVCVGPGGMVDGHEVEMVVKTGDKVLLSRFTGSVVKVDGEELTIARQSDIIAIIE